MKKEIIITIKNEATAIDIFVSPEITVSDLIDIMAKKIIIPKIYSFYSVNHHKKLDSDSTLYDEKIWTGDILEVI